MSSFTFYPETSSASFIARTLRKDRRSAGSSSSSDDSEGREKPAILILRQEVQELPINRVLVSSFSD
jgi:hypothetical protein